jgi:hypothetical protein
MQQNLTPSESLFLQLIALTASPADATFLKFLGKMLNLRGTNHVNYMFNYSTSTV